MTNFLFSDFLRELQVPHTVGYTNERFSAMPFPTLFGLQKLLEEYNVPSKGYKVEDKQELTQLSTPYLAHTPRGFLIVTGFNGGKVQYLTQGEAEEMSVAALEAASDGIIFMAFPTAESHEPNYGEHARIEFINRGKKWVLALLGLLLFAYLFITNKIYSHATTVLLAAFDLFGLYVTTLLVQKSMKVKNKTADKFCAVLEEGGCDHVLSLKASSFYGIFSWSEVGFAYFSVSLLALLIFPQWIMYLAACNICCLPFTLWSIWYQKFRAKVWCTLCVTVQATLWALFICYLTGGWLEGIFPLRIEFFVLVASYGFALLLLNKIVPMITKRQGDEDTEENSSSAV